MVATIPLFSSSQTHEAVRYKKKKKNSLNRKRKVACGKDKYNHTKTDSQPHLLLHALVPSIIYQLLLHMKLLHPYLLCYPYFTL